MAMDPDQQAPTRISRQQVLATIRDLRADHRQASRQAIADLLGVKLSIVDEHVKNLRDEGLVFAVIPGIFEPVDCRTDRAVSGTWTETAAGTVYKLEIGDHCIEMSPRETRQVALLTGGVLLAGR